MDVLGRIDCPIFAILDNIAALLDETGGLTSGSFISSASVLSTSIISISRAISLSLGYPGPKLIYPRKESLLISTL